MVLLFFEATPKSRVTSKERKKEEIGIIHQINEINVQGGRLPELPSAVARFRLTGVLVMQDQYTGGAILIKAASAPALMFSGFK